MQTLFILIFCIFAAVALMVLVTQRYRKAGEEVAQSKLQRWIAPLVGLVLVLSALDYFFGGG